MSDNQKRIEASKRFAHRQREVLGEADARAEARPKLELEPEPAEDAWRRDLVKDLAMRGAFSDERLLSLVRDRLGSAAWSDQALALLDELLHVLTSGRGDDE